MCTCICMYICGSIPQRERSRYPTAPGQLGDRSRGYGQSLEKAGDGNGALGPDCCGISSFETRLSPAGRKPPEGRLPQLRAWGHQDVYNYRSWAGGLVWHYILLVSWLIHRPDGSLDFRRKTIKQSLNKYIETASKIAGFCAWAPGFLLFKVSISCVFTPEGAMGCHNQDGRSGDGGVDGVTLHLVGSQYAVLLGSAGFLDRWSSSWHFHFGYSIRGPKSRVLTSRGFHKNHLRPAQILVDGKKRAKLGKLPHLAGKTMVHCRSTH